MLLPTPEQLAREQKEDREGRLRTKINCSTFQFYASQFCCVMFCKKTVTGAVCHQSSYSQTYLGRNIAFWFTVAPAKVCITCSEQLSFEEWREGKKIIDCPSRRQLEKVRVLSGATLFTSPCCFLLPLQVEHLEICTSRHRGSFYLHEKASKYQVR